jgi:hypothetical protein
MNIKMMLAPLAVGTAIFGTSVAANASTTHIPGGYPGPIAGNCHHSGLPGMNWDNCRDCKTVTVWETVWTWQHGHLVREVIPQHVEICLPGGNGGNPGVPPKGGCSPQELTATVGGTEEQAHEILTLQQGTLADGTEVSVNGTDYWVIDASGSTFELTATQYSSVPASFPEQQKLELETVC